jgi:ABC-type antimicrobial peptide transport system permease subunit
MIRNYVRVALRGISKYRSYVAINTFGLGIALACCITAYMLIAYNIEFDDYFSDRQVRNVYRIHTVLEESDQSTSINVNAPLNLAPEAASQFTGIKQYNRLVAESGFASNGEESFAEFFYFSDSNFFDLFPFDFTAGTGGSFKDIYSIMISDEMALKYFEGQNPIGQTLILNFANDHQMSLTVGGVFQKLPLNSSLVFDFLIRIEHFYKIYNLSTEEWGGRRDPAQFFELEEPGRAEELTALFDAFIPIRNEERDDQEVVKYELHHFKSAISQDDIGWSYLNVRLSMLPITIFSVMALIILLIACFNLTNTSIAITAKRLKEIGVRKAIGSSRTQIIIQFIVEMIITILMALGVGFLVSVVIVPEFNRLWNIDYGLWDLNGLNFVVAMVTLVFVAALLAGLYPAMFSSRLSPVLLLRRNVKIKGTNVFTRSLITIQFSLSVVVLLAGLVFIQNNQFQENLSYGYDKDMVLEVSILGEKEYQLLKAEITNNPKVLSTSITHHLAGYSSYPFPLEVNGEEYDVQHIEVGENFFETMGFRLIEGRFLNFESDEDRNTGLIVNRAFLDKTHIKDAINQMVRIRDRNYYILGVIENHVDNVFRSSEMEPFAYYPSRPDEYESMLVRAEESDLVEVKDYMESVWKEIFPYKPFIYQFQDDITMQFTRQVNGNMKRIFIFLTILGGLLSASGIFALTSLNVEKRNKEIGIRKSMGATVRDILLILNKEFLYVMIFAGILGSVAGYFLTDLLLGQIYAYHIGIGVVPILGSALIIILIGFGTTNSITIGAANSNPVDTLRDE